MGCGTPHTLLLDETLRDTTSASRAEKSEFPYDMALPAIAACRPIDAYCGADGPQLFRDDLSNAVHELAECVRRDLGLDVPLAKGGQAP